MLGTVQCQLCTNGEKAYVFWKSTTFKATTVLSGGNAEETETFRGAGNLPILARDRNVSLIVGPMQIGIFGVSVHGPIESEEQEARMYDLHDGVAAAELLEQE